MNKKSYFILNSSEDGTSIEQVDVDGLIQRITPDSEGYTYYGQNLSFLDKVPEQDKGSWYAKEGAILIIHGEIVIPKAKEVAIRYELT